MYSIAILLLILGWITLLIRQIKKKDFYNLLAITAVLCFTIAPILAYIERFY